MFAFHNNSIFIWGIIQIVFWALSFIVGILKLIVSALLIYPLSLMIASIPDPFSSGFGFGFIIDLFKSFFGLLLFLLVEGVMEGGDLFFNLLCLVFNLFIVNESREIADNAVSICAYNLGIGGSITSWPGDIVILSKDWFVDIVEKINSNLIRTIKVPSVMFWEDVMMLSAPSWSTEFLYLEWFEWPERGGSPGDGA